MGLGQVGLEVVILLLGTFTLLLTLLLTLFDPRRRCGVHCGRVTHMRVRAKVADGIRSMPLLGSTWSIGFHSDREHCQVQVVRVYSHEAV
jgi:hypothetical protein